jgi:DNA-binding SARP family transcriptional activator
VFLGVHPAAPRAGRAGRCFTAVAPPAARATPDAAPLQGTDRLEALRSAFALHERGPFLPGVRAEWAEERDRALRGLVTDAREEAAALALALGDLDETERQAELVLADDPFRESCWRALMQSAQLRGNEGRVIAIYQDCRARFDELGSEPSAATQRLLTDLRR